MSVVVLNTVCVLLMSASLPSLTAESQPRVQSANRPSGVLARLQKTWQRDILPVFQSVQLAIVLLSLLSLSVLGGVLMPQEALVDPLAIKTQFGVWYKPLKALGAFTWFTSPGFLALEGLFFISLLCGSFRWLKPAWIAATRTWFYDAPTMQARQAHTWFDTAATPEALQAQLQQWFRARGYRVALNTAAQSVRQLYATQGRWSRLGPVIAHTGILLMIVFSVFGAFTGFKAQQLLTPGQAFFLNKPDKLIPNMPMPFWQGSVPDWGLRLKTFSVERYAARPDVVKQYTSELEILDPDGRVIGNQAISVNTPLFKGDVSVYQASYLPTGKFFLTINGKPQTLSINSQFQNREVITAPLNTLVPGGPKEAALIIFPFFVQKEPQAQTDHIRVFLHQNGRFLGESTPGQPAKMPQTLRLEPGQSGTLGSLQIGFQQPEVATGLQIKKAPETWPIYAAFAIICFGTALCFFSQRQWWVAIEPTELPDRYRVVLFGQTNKAQLSFAQERQRLLQALAPLSSGGTP